MVHDAGQADAQQTFLFLVLLPDVTDVAEVGQHRLVGTNDGGQTNLFQQIGQGVFMANDHFRQVADASRAQGDLGTRIDANNLGCITTTAFHSFLDGCGSVEDATLTRLGFNQGQPLLHEQFHFRTFGVGG